jgi:hypothetical protein
MTITKRLQQDHLWVDQFCINQEVKILQQEAIQNMDIIYEDADLTICALSSPMSQSGIRGVSTPFYPVPQYTYQTNKYTLTATGTGHVLADMTQSV